METYNKPISVIAPVGEAIEKTKILLFKPFDLERWLIIGFCAWLANLINEGVRGAMSLRFGRTEQQPPQWSKIADFIRENLLLFGIIAGAAILIYLIVIVVLLWLNSRGKFMFTDCLAKNKAQLVVPWKNNKRQADSLFGFRLILIIISYGLITALSVPIVFLALAIKSNTIGLAVSIAAISGIVLIIITVMFFFAVIKSLTFDFVLPIMYIKKIGTLAAWKIFYQPLKTHLLKIILYLLFKLLLLMAVSAIIMAITFVGCCCLCCTGLLLFIPYFGTVILLPFPCFVRLYSLCFLRQFGREYDVFVSA